MKALLEKIKSLDKKVLIGAGAGIAALIIAIVVILVVCLGGKDKEVDKDKEKDKTTYEQNDDKDKDEDKDKEDEKEATFTVKVVDADGAAVAGVVVQVCKDECVPATTDETGVATFKVEITEGYKLSVVTLPEGYEYTGGEVSLAAGITEYELKIQKKAESSDSGNGGQTATQRPTTITPEGEEIIGDGSKNNPYTLMPKSDAVYKTFSIPAGSKSYYEISRVGNMILTINDANAYVIESNGTRHNASGGKVSFTVEDALASDYVLFQIGNNGSTAKTFTIKFSKPTGSRENPTVIKSIAEVSGGCSLSLKNGNDQGHYYKYVAEKTGIIRFYISSFKSSASNASGSIKVDKILPGDVVEQTNFEEGPVKEEKDENGNVLYKYIEVSVNANEVLYINVASTSTSQRTPFPAADITWNAKY